MASITTKRRTKLPGQQYLDVAEVRDGVVILRDGTFRAVLMASSLNFALKSEAEQTAIIHGYQEALNALGYPMQIVVTSRRIDIAPYLRELDEREEAQESELMKIQLQEYREYIRELVRVSNVMTKSFYIVLPFSPIQAKEESLFRRLRKTFRVRSGIGSLTPTDFHRYRDQLWQRVDQVATTLSGIGIRLVPLNTQELIELYYTLYNPETAPHQHLAPVEDLQVEDVEPAALAEAQPTPEERERYRYTTVKAPDAETAERLYRARQARED